MNLLRAPLASGAISDDYRTWAVEDGAKNGHLEIVRELLANGNISLVNRFIAFLSATNARDYKIALELYPPKAILATVCLCLASDLLTG